MSFESKKEKAKLDIFIKSINNTGMRAILQGFNKTIEGYSLPGNIVSVGSIPHSWLFKHAYCVIHHGGFGTTAASLRAGIPSIVIPHVLDQYEWANKVYTLGAGPCPIRCSELNEKNLTDTIHWFKTNYSDISRNAKQISFKMQSENGLKSSVELIKASING